MSQDNLKPVPEIDLEIVWEAHSESIEVIRCSQIGNEIVMTERDFMKAAQSIIAIPSATEKRLRDALIAIREHHLILNNGAKRPIDRSKTISLCDAALAHPREEGENG